ncbi:MAG: glutathione S-transferase N-terminal domain-containing protein, partial [Pseudomonadota bacterium]
KGVAYDVVEVNPFAPAPSTNPHPFGLVPTLSHDGFVIYETLAISTRSAMTRQSVGSAKRFAPSSADAASRRQAHWHWRRTRRRSSRSSTSRRDCSERQAERKARSSPNRVCEG